MHYTALLVSRPKLNLCGTHYGVQIDDNTIIDPQSDGIKIISKNDFAKGFLVSIETSRKIPFHEISTIKEKIGKFEYNFFDNNCEHFSRDVVENKKESKQITILIFVAFMALILWLLTKES